MYVKYEALKNEVCRAIECSEYSAALKKVKEALCADSCNPELLCLMGMIEEGLQDQNKAYEYYRQAFYYDKTNCEAAAGLLWLCGEKMNPVVKEELFGIIRDDAGELSFLARYQYYFEKHNIRQAVSEMKAARERYPESIRIMLGYIEALTVNGSGSQEILPLFKEVKKRTRDPKVIELELKYLYKAGLFEECERACKKAAMRYPNSDVSQMSVTLKKKIADRRAREEEKKQSENENTAEREKPAGPANHARNFDMTAGDVSIGEALEKLDRLIGLTSVKKEIHKIQKTIEFDKIRRERLHLDPQGDRESYHFVFSGNPGTGKTTVARLLADIFHGFGLLEKGQLIEVDRSDLVGEFQGHTAKKTKDVVEKALGGVLFIDEAYSLVNGENDDFGKEAIDTLVKAVEDHRTEFIVILAGYRQEMYELVKSNVGLESRFTKYIDFPDYTEEELLEIGKLFARDNHYEFSADGEIAFKEVIGKKKVNQKFGNARAVRNLMNEAFAEKAANFDPGNISMEYLTVLTPQDFGIDIMRNPEENARAALEKLQKLTGLKDVKYEIKSSVSMARYQKREAAAGRKVRPINMHLCFTGNPGTGKTTVARLYAEILASIGILKTGEVIEASRDRLVGVHLGETAQKTKELCEQAYGGLLFIDEAYSLVHGSHDSFGQEAVDTLIQEMENNRDKLVVILAGYSKEMHDFMGTNSGIASRIGKVIEFTDYDVDELKTIFDGYIEDNDILLDERTRSLIYQKIERMYAARDDRFGNAREMRRLYERIWLNMVNRVESRKLEGADRRRFLPEDIER